MQNVVKASTIVPMHHKRGDLDVVRRACAKVRPAFRDAIVFSAPMETVEVPVQRP